MIANSVPADDSAGKLRLMYKVNSMALTIEQAEGHAFAGPGRIMDVRRRRSVSGNCRYRCDR